MVQYIWFVLARHTGNCGLRDYGTAQWQGGDAGCDHKKENRAGKTAIVGNTLSGEADFYRDTCGKCGAKRIDRQIGQEPTPDAYVQTMVEVFREVRRCLHDSGTVWLNVGDSYNSIAGNYRGLEQGMKKEDAKITLGGGIAKTMKAHQYEARPSYVEGLKPKDLCLIPWRLAIALQSDGWWVRSVICWHKKSCMPESVTDRPTNSWEPIFLLAKNSRYFYDAEAVKEPNTEDMQARAAKGHTRGGNGKLDASRCDFDTLRGEDAKVITATGRNQRNVWSLGPEPYSEAHFATFPTEIPRRAILAGTSARGCCPKCREPWVRLVERSAMEIKRSSRGEKIFGNNHSTAASGTMTKPPESKTIGWEPGCKCGVTDYTVAATVLDPFGGSGTTGAVALELGRHAIICELNPAYVELIETRTHVTPGLPLA